MSVSSVLHRSCDSDLGVRSSGDCFDIQSLLLSAAALQGSGPLAWVAMRSLSLIRLNTRLERSIEPPLASTCSLGLDKEKVFPRIDNAETSTSRETTRSCTLLGDLPLARSWSLALRVRWSPRTDAHLFLFVAANRSGCLFGKAAHSPGFVPGWCLPEQESLESDEPPGSCCHCPAVSLERQAAICIRCRCLTRLVFARSPLRLVTGKVSCSRNFKKVTANISSTFYA